MKVEKIIPKIKRNVSLKNLNSLRIGGKAKFFLEIENKEELIQGIKKAKKLNIPFFILGGGSNVLIPNGIYEGLVIKVSMEGIQKKKNKEKKNIVNVKSGTPLNKVVSFCLENQLGGIEWAVGIPGTIGGAVRGNAGAFGKSIQDNIVSVSFFDVSNFNTGEIFFEDCQFGYRDSIFKKNSNWIILEVNFLFKKKAKNLIQKEMNNYLKERAQKKPKGFSAGSVFKNYQIKNSKEKEKILSQFPEISNVIKNNLIPAGFLVESCGLKGKKSGGAIISEEHANFIINNGKAKFENVNKLIILTKEKVKKKFGIILEEEIQRINF